MFPDAELVLEHSLGFSKSLIAVKRQHRKALKNYETEEPSCTRKYARHFGTDALPAGRCGHIQADPGLRAADHALQRALRYVQLLGDPPKDELPAAVWTAFLKELKDFSGTFSINFSGGEPLLQTDLFEILEFCQRERIIAGIITNGLLLNGTNAKRLIDCGVFNINVSIDSMSDDVHDAMKRGSRRPVEDQEKSEPSYRLRAHLTQ